MNSCTKNPDFAHFKAEYLTCVLAFPHHWRLLVEYPLPKPLFFIVFICVYYLLFLQVIKKIWYSPHLSFLIKTKKIIRSIQADILKVNSQKKNSGNKKKKYYGKIIILKYNNKKLAYVFGAQTMLGPIQKNDLSAHFVALVIYKFRCQCNAEYVGRQVKIWNHGSANTYPAISTREKVDNFNRCVIRFSNSWIFDWKPVVYPFL